MFLNETYGRVQVGKHLTCFLLGTVWNKEILYCYCFSTLLSRSPEGSGKSGWLEVKWYLPAISLCWWCKCIRRKHT